MRFWGGLVAGLCAGIWSAASAAPLEAYGALPSVENVDISPDGKLFAYTTDVGGERAIVVIGLDDHKLVAGGKVGDVKIRDLHFADNDNLLITTSTTRAPFGVTASRQEWFLVGCLNIQTHKIGLLLENEPDSMNTVNGPPTVRIIDGHTVVFMTGITFQVGRGVAALFSVDLTSDHTAHVETGVTGTVDWVLDAAGNAVAREDYDENAEAWRLMTRDGDSWRETYRYPAPIDTPDIEGITPDGGALVISLPDADDLEVKLADGSVSKANDLGSYSGIVQDPVTHRIIGTVTYGTTTTYRFLARADQMAWNSVAAAFSGENLELQGWSADRKRIVVRVDGPSDGAVYQLVDLNTHQATVLGAVYREIGSSDVSPVKYIHYLAADGLDIPAYLTLPLGRGLKNLPLVVLPHGGPAAADDPQFDWWSQALASRGYAVLQPQFRGSTRHGWSFLKAGFGEWGRKMQTDLSDGVRFLAAQGTIDPKRVCIVGASYGGYAALAGAALDRGVYRCAVSVAGVSDPHTMLSWERSQVGRRDSLTVRYWTRFMGAEDIDDPKLDQISPLVHAADVDIPVLLIHGKDDTVVPIAQSAAMQDALEDAHKSVRLVKLDGEDHWLSRPETRLRMLTETVQFLEANNPPN